MKRTILAAVILISTACSAQKYWKVGTYICPNGQESVDLSATSPSGPWTIDDQSDAQRIEATCKPAALEDHPKKAPESKRREKYSDELNKQLASSYITPSNSPTENKTNSSSDSIAYGSILLVLIVVIYIFPISVAMARECKATAGIAVVNVFLGWTFVGWVVALAWAASGEKKSKIAQ